MSYEVRYNPIDLEEDVAVGIKLPLVGKNGILFDLSYSTEEQALSNLKNLVLTRQGERILQPLFGTRLQDSLFEQNTDVLKEQIQSSILEAISFWLPYIRVNDIIVQTVIAAGPSNQEHGITISLRVSVNEQEVNTPVTFLVTPTTVEEVII
jgi:phage baseplate assembly protein W